MENLADQKRNWRLEAMFAALDVAGRGEDVPIMEEFLPTERRRYLHHDPSGDPRASLGTDRLHDLLCAEKVPHMIDLDRASSNFGVRYMATVMPLPKSLAPFVGDKAQSAWRDWKREQDDMKNAVSQVLQVAGQIGPISDERTLADRVNTRASEMKTVKPERQPGSKTTPERD